MGEQKTVVITGANSGIGLATALELAGAGYDVVGTTRTTAKAELVASAAQERGVTVRTVLCDVTKADETAAALDEVEASSASGIWAVVNNAGYAQAGAVEDVGDDLVWAQLAVNLVAPARIARHVLPAMRARGDGRIVNISSIAGRVAAPMLGWYAASKHGLEALSDALRTEVSPFGIRVVLIEPGAFSTGIWEGGAQSLPTQQSEAYAGAYARMGGVTGATAKMPHPVWVARVVRVALSSPVPLARYLVGFDAMGGALASSLAPTLLSDYVKQVGTGLRRAPLLGRWRG